MWSARQAWKRDRRAAGFFGGLLATFLVVAAPAAAAFVEPINLSNSSAVVSGRPAIAVNRAGQVFAVYEEGTDIYFTRSEAAQASCGGLKFEAPRPLSAGTGLASLPAVAVNDSHGVFVVWQAGSEIWFSRSADDGQTFELPVNLSQNASASNAPTVAADNFGGVFVAWSDGSLSGQIFFRRNSGATFEPAVNLSLTPFTRSAQAPSLATDGSNVFLAWEERFGLAFLGSAIKYKKFGRSDVLTTVAGLFATDLSTGQVPGSAFGSSLAFGDGTLSVVFRTFTAVFHRSSSDGIAFSLPVQNLSGPVVIPNGSRARAARHNGSALVAWPETVAANPEIRYRVLGNGTTAGPEPVLTTAARRGSPAAAVDSTGRLLVAWQGRETADLLNDEVYVSYSGGTGGGSLVNALVEMTPQTLNAKTMYQGQGVFTLRIRFMDGSAVDIPLSLELNGHAVTPLRSSLVDTDGNGAPDTLEVKIKRHDLQFEGATLTAAQGSGGTYAADVKVKGNMTGGRCFSGTGDVRIIHQ